MGRFCIHVIISKLQHLRLNRIGFFRGLRSVPKYHSYHLTLPVIDRRAGTLMVLAPLTDGVFNRARVMLGIAELPLTISSTWNLFLQSAFNRVRILLVIAGLPLLISSNRSHFFFLHGFPNRAMMMFCIAGSSCDYSVHKEVFLSSPGCLQQGHDHMGITCFPLTIPSTRNHLFFLFLV